MSINKVFLSGYLLRDPELRATPSGTAVLSLGLSVPDRRRDKQTGEWGNYPCFIDCTMFGTRAEKVSQFLRKGSKVSIEGKLRWSLWEREGQKRSKLDVIIGELELMTQNETQPAPQPVQQYAPNTVQPQPVQQPQQVVSSVYEEDIPF